MGEQSGSDISQAAVLHLIVGTLLHQGVTHVLRPWQKRLDASVVDSDRMRLEIQIIFQAFLVDCWTQGKHLMNSLSK